MEEFKKKIKKRITLLSIVVLGLTILGIYDRFVVGDAGKTSFGDGFIDGFQLGIIFAIGVLALVQLIIFQMAIKDDKKLKILYNREQDERLKAIRSKAGMPMLLITSVLMLIAGIIAGYYNITIFYTLVVASVTQMTLGAIIKIYYMKTM